MSNPHPRGRDTSSQLTEVRTVLSRAENALGLHANDRYCRTPEASERFFREDPDGEAMLAALREVVRLLDPWRRTGRPRKGDSRG